MGLCPFSPPKRLPPSFLRLRALRFRAAGSLRSLFSPSSPTARAAPGSSEALLRINEGESEVDDTTTRQAETIERADIYQRITDRIAAAIEAGAGEWRMPWHPGADGVAPVLSVNAATRQRASHTGA